MSASVDQVSGSHAQIEQYFRAHGPAVRKLCVSLLGAEPGAEVAQETFVRALHSLNKDPRLNAYPRAWLLTIARNLCTDHARKIRATPRTSILDAETVDRRLELDSESRTRDPTFERVAARERASKIRPALVSALQTLRPVERRILLDHEEGSLGLEAIARREGASVDSVRNTVYRARQQLRNVLSRDLLAPSLVAWTQIRALVRRWMNQPWLNSPDTSTAWQLAAAGLVVVLGSLMSPARLSHVPVREVTSRLMAVGAGGRATSPPAAEGHGVTFAPQTPSAPVPPVSINFDPGHRGDHAATPRRSKMRVTVRGLDDSDAAGTDTEAGCFDHPSASLPQWSPVWTSC